MYDNVDFNLKNEHCPQINFLDSVPQFLSTVTTTGATDSCQFITGRLENLRLTITENQVKVSNSSICKYYLGDNFSTLTRSDTQKLIEKISDTLHLPFDKADVTRIDWAQNLIMDYPESVYYNYLGEAPHYTRLNQNNGLYFNNGLRQLVFYGKEFEQKQKHCPIPELYQNRNVLRYEIRFKKRIKQQLKQPDLKLARLYNDEFYRQMLNRWKEEYLKIYKIKTPLNNMIPTGSRKELIDGLALIALLDLGQHQILNHIKEWQSRSSITKKQAYDLRKAIRELGAQKSQNDNQDMISELTQKIMQASKYW